MSHSEDAAVGTGSQGSAPSTTVSMRDAVPVQLDETQLLSGTAYGHCVLSEAMLVERHSTVRLHYAPKATEALTRLKPYFADPSFNSAPLVAARMNDVALDLSLGVVTLRDGRFVAETLVVARSVDPNLTTAVGEHDDWAQLPPHRRPILHLFHRSAPAYGHFLLDCMVPLAFFLPTIKAGGLDLLLPAFLPGWVRTILVEAGVPEAALVQPASTAILCHDLVLVSSVNTMTTFLPNPTLCAALAKTMAAPYKSAPSRLLYLSRAGQHSYSQRWLSNEPDLQDMLASRGFEVLQTGNMPFTEQVRVFAEARVIVGAHGSAFGNLLFAHPGAVVVDLMPADWVDYWKADGIPERWLLNLTTAMGLDYELILCESRLVRLLADDDRSGLQKFGMESVIDIDLVASVVDALSPVATADGGAARRQE